MSLSGEELYDLWAPDTSPWSVWAKPVLFAGIKQAGQSALPLELPSVAGVPAPSTTAVIVDMPGPESVLTGLALAGRGYMPVPLYNSGSERGGLVNMEAIANHLGFAAQARAACLLQSDAPPAFLLNADRLDNAADAKKTGRYDNRWCVVPQDMPSADFLKNAGISRIVLIASKVMDDLSHVLLRYQEAGIVIQRTADAAQLPSPVTITKPPFFRSFFQRMQVYAGLRRSAVGGFGAVVPDPETSGGFFG